jgi:hypothetical protein
MPAHGAETERLDPCSEGLDRALPANLLISLSQETIGGEIVDRDWNHQPFDSRGGFGDGNTSKKYLQRN